MKSGFAAHPIWDLCVSIDSSGRETRRTMHYFRNTAPGQKPVWICANCGQVKP
jgi:hypothetical protein